MSSDLRKVRNGDDVRLTGESIIYEDNSIIVIHKPAGVATETKRIGEEDCVSFIKNHIGDRKSVV